MRRSRFRHLVGMCVVLTAAGLARPVPAVAQDTGRSVSYAGEMLLSQANFWWHQGDAARAMVPLTQLLDHEPNNADGLAMLAEISAEQGKGDIARAKLERLRAMHPDDPRLARLEPLVKRGAIDQAVITRARAALQAGRAEEAVRLYRQAMGLNGSADVPPQSLAREYYSALGSTGQGIQPALAGLGRLVKDDPSDIRLQLTYAQLLTVQNATRPEAVGRLVTLQQYGPIAAEATASLRRALLGLPGEASSVPYLQAYLARTPDDAEIRRRLDVILNPDLDPTQAAPRAREQGFAALKQNKVSAAEAAFQKALGLNADDADATGGLGLVRSRQNRVAEARTLLQRAAGLDAHWEEARRSLDAASTSSDAARQAVMQRYAQVARLAAQGETDQAEQQLLKLMNGGGNAGNFIQLGSIQAEAGRLDAAEASYRRALAMEPGNRNAVSGLASVLDRQGRESEVTALLPQLPAAQRQAIERSRAETLRTQAQATRDPATALGLLRDAVSLDPANPWTRLNYAQALIKQGRKGEAVQTMGDVGRVDVADTQAVQAQVIFSQQIGDEDRAAQLIARVPPGRWTADMRDIAARQQLRQQIRQAMQAESPAAARAALQALAAQPDPQGTRTIEIARALIRAGARGTAGQIALDATKPGNTLSAAQRLGYAGVLLDAGRDREARMLAQATNPATLPADQRQVRDRLLDGIAIRQSDTLVGRGYADDALKTLEPRVQASPGQPDLSMALARVYQQTGDAGAALSLDKSVLQQDRDNLDLRSAAVDAALSAGDTGQARALAKEGLLVAPRDPRPHLMVARAAQASGDSGTALREFEAARVLRSQQIEAARRAGP